MEPQKLDAKSFNAGVEAAANYMDVSGTTFSWADSIRELKITDLPPDYAYHNLLVKSVGSKPKGIKRWNLWLGWGLLLLIVYFGWVAAK